MKRQVPEEEEEISPKSRGILYKLKQTLSKKNLSLSDFVNNMFGFHKEKFNRSEFENLIKKYDQNLIYDDIDKLFEELDDSKNNFVFYYRLNQVYQTINEKDSIEGPSNSDSIKNLFKQRIGKIFTRMEPTQDEVIQEVKTLLLSSEDVYEVIDLFAVEKTGFLSVENVIELLKNFEYDNNKRRRILLEFLFGSRDKISIEDFIKKLGLDVSARRVNISRLKVPTSMDEEPSQHELENSEVKPQPEQIDEELKSVFVKSRLEESLKLEDSLSVDLKSVKSLDHSEFIPLEKVPKELTPFFNYGSVLEPEFALQASEYINQKQIFIDPQSPNYSKAFQWIHLSEHYSSYTLFRVSESVLIRDKNKKGLAQLLESKDIIQGRLGDCYFLSAISAIVENYPELVYRLLVLDKNPAHLYGIRLFIDGMWRTIIVDACFPISKERMFCGAQPYKSQIWVMLLEKAWAKVFGSYDQIHAGYNEEGLTAMAGAPSIHTSTRSDGFFKKIQVHLKKGSIITCATSAEVQQMTDKQQNQRGIYSNHAYTLMRVYPDLPYKYKDTQMKVTLIKIRNPWGRKQWKGDWSYYSSKWTNELKQITNYKHNPEDGSFFMCYEDFAVFFDFVNICQVNLSYVNSTINIHCERNDFVAVKVKVKQRGDYFFTQYQENPRKYKNSFNYQKSKTWMYLSKIKGKSADKSQREAIGSHCTDYRDNTLEATLEPGEYILLVKVGWKYWDSYSYNLTSYGPQKVKFEIDYEQSKKWQNELSMFIESKSLWGMGKMSNYTYDKMKLNLTKRIYFDATEGYGFLEIANKESFLLTTKVTLSPCRGISVLEPYGLPMTLEIFPNETVVVKFVVDPSGYAYQYKENFYINQ